MSSKAYFEEVARDWDTMRTEFFSEGVRDKACAAAGLQPGMTAADIGAGSGFVSEALLARGVHVIAVDQSPEMLAELQRRLGSQGVTCREGEAERLPIADGGVERAFANMFLHHVERPPETIREMARVLAPGGRLIVTDVDRHTHTWLLEEHHDRWPGFAREDVRRWFEEAGLRNVSVTDAGED